MKKTLCIIITFMILVSTINIAGYAAQEENSVNYKEKLIAMGIIEKSYFSQSTHISRADYARLMVDFLNIEIITENKNTRFIDVDVNHPSIGAINYLFDLNYVSGYPGYLFKPDENITFIDAVAMILLPMGYGYRIKGETNYSQAVYLVASGLGLLEGVDKNNIESNLIDEATAMRIMVNALKAKVMVLDLDGNSVYKGGTFLENNYNIYTAKGIVNKTRYTSLASATEAVKEDYLSIGDSLFYTTEDYSKYLGYEVEYYYKYDDNDLELVYLEKTKKNTEIIIDSENIENFGENGIRYYTKEGTIKTIKLGTVKVIYNLVAYTGYGTIDSINIDDSNIIVVSNDGDSNADVIFITNYDDYYISRVDYKNSVIYDDLNNRSVNIDSKEYNVEIYNEDGNVVSLESINPGIVASVSTSKNTDGIIVKKVYLVNNAVEGIVTSIDSADKIYTINNAGYKLTSSCTQSVSLSMDAVFYIGKTGKIVARILKTGSKTIGVVRGLYNDGNAFEELYIKIYTQNGEFVLYKFPKKIRVNSVAVKATVNLLEGKGIVPGQVILFTQKDNVIQTIEIPKAINNGEKGGFRMLGEGSSFESLQQIINGSAVTQEGRTVFMSVPTDITDEEAYSIISFGEYNSQLKSKRYSLYSSGSDDLNVADLVIGYDAAASVLNDSTSDIYLVTEKYEGLDENNDIAKKFNVVHPQKGESAISLVNNLDTSIEQGYIKDNGSITAVTGVTFDDVDTGDVIRIAKNSVGKVTRMELVFDSSNPNNTKARIEVSKGYVDTCHYYSDSKYIAMGRIIYSTIEAAGDTAIQYKTTFFKTSVDWRNHNNFIYRTEMSGINSDNKVIVYDKKKNTYKNIKRSELKNYKGKEFVMTVNQNNIQNVVIYE